AVETTKLSLLLKALEGENDTSLSKQMTLFHERALPNLSDNIKCGNSLISPDYFSGKMFPDSEELLRIKPFDWANEFSAIMAAGGFDAVIGNPPWAFTKYVDWGDETKSYIQQRYLSTRSKDVQSRARQAGKINLFAIFALKAINVLRRNGLMGIILPNNILRTTVYDVVRKQILEISTIRKIVDLKAGVFQGVTASTVIIILEANLPIASHSIEIVDNQTLGIVEDKVANKLNQADCLKNPSCVIDIFSDTSLKRIISKADAVSTKLGEIADVLNGIATEKNMAGILDSRKNNNSKPILFGKDIVRYHFEHSGKYVNYVRAQLLRARDESIFLAPQKLIMQRIGGILVTAYDNHQYYTFNSVNNLLLKSDSHYNLKYLLGILNSKLLRVYYIARFTNKSSLTVNVSKTFIDQLPIRTVNFSDFSDKARHDKMVQLVESMLALSEHKAAARTQAEQEQIQRQIDATDRQIDTLVYELYGLTEKEIKIVEGVR
ncbi:MAG: N-6 DNA methylase, partial [Thermodesulfovibrionales bacterium]|nr:N-6 DNA methylase [Thermodesulfovibrionales bacterium]